MKKVRVLFVCLGNICRSPLAEAIFKNKVKAKDLDALFESDSCGTSNYNIGDAPDPRTQSNAQKNGIVLDHCARQLCSADLNDFDFILAMDKSNFQNILKLPGAEQFRSKVKMMRAFDPAGAGDVPDPYFGGEKGFQQVFEMLNRSIEKFLEYVAEEHLKTGTK